MSTAKKIRQQFLSALRREDATDTPPVNTYLYSLVKVLIVAALCYVIIFM